MNKLVLLNEVRKNKNSDKSLKTESKKSFSLFKEKFDFFENKEGFINLNLKKINNTQSEKALNKILNRIFSINNRKLLIGFINSIYCDSLSNQTKIEFIKENVNSEGLADSNYNLKLVAKDDYRKFEYHIQFQTKDDENMAIVLNKLDLSTNCENVVHFNRKKHELQVDKIDKTLNNNSKRCLIILNSNIEVPDIYEIESSSSESKIDSKVNIIKSWKYDFKQLFEKNMYLLFPMKVLDLKKRLLNMSQEIGLENLIRDDIFRFFKDMNKYLNMIKEKKLITNKEITEINLISVELLDSFIKDKNNIFINIKNEIKATLKEIVV